MVISQRSRQGTAVDENAVHTRVTRGSAVGCVNGVEKRANVEVHNMHKGVLSNINYTLTKPCVSEDREQLCTECSCVPQHKKVLEHKTKQGSNPFEPNVCDRSGCNGCARSLASAESLSARVCADSRHSSVVV